MGTTTNAIPVRLERGEPADVLIMVGYALNDLGNKGMVVEGSQVELVKSAIGVAVKAGAPRPDISSADAVKHALLSAKSVAYSDSASKITVFSAGIATGSKEPEAGKALIKFMASPEASAEIVKSGMEPIATATH